MKNGKRYMTLNGKYGTANVYIDQIEDAARDQIIKLLNQEFVSGSTIRIMPDVHAGVGCTIGTTMKIKDKVCPNLVGVDIGCGMRVVKLSLKKDEVDFTKLDKIIYDNIPSGYNIRDRIHPYYFNTRVSELCCLLNIDTSRVARSIGTLGGGNHFIELDEDSNGYLYLVIHTGSRHLGVEVNNYYQRKAYNAAKKQFKQYRQHVIATLRWTGGEKHIQSELDKLKFDIPKELCHLSGLSYYEYLHDMKIVQDYAKWNRSAIADVIINNMNWYGRVEEEFETIHNYIDTADMILRKGAVSAYRGEKLIIPMNMREGAILCSGKANPDWNYSAPHGAGRLMSRKDAKKYTPLELYKQSMKGIYTTSVNENTLDESPFAYKPMSVIMDAIGDTVDVIDVIRPLYNFKDSVKPRRKD